MHTITSETREMRYLCGAPLNAGSKRCGKCLARARWYRRKAWRTHDSAIKRNRKK
jgi:hypothetical protein